MGLLRRLGLVSVGVGLVLAAQVARAQGGCTFTDDNGKTVFWPNCQPPADAKSADGKVAPANGSAPVNAPAPAKGSAPGNAPGSSPAKSFPFPGETPAAAPKMPSAPGAGAGQKAAGTGAAGTAGAAGAADKFPFPGEDSSGAAKGAGGGAKGGGDKGGGDKAAPSSSGPLQDAGSSGSSSSDNSGDDPTAGPLGDPDPAAKAAEARRAARKKKGIDFHQTMDQREAEDLKVAAFYQGDGDYKGAYERASDAVSIAADDAEAQLALADAARRLGKLDEAETHYKKCLALDPVPKTRNAAERALKQMTLGG